jgi:CAAX protease family protein
MEPEDQRAEQDQPPGEPGAESSLLPEPASSARMASKPHRLTWVFIGPQGLRAGWSAALFVLFSVVFSKTIETALGVVSQRQQGTVSSLSPFMLLLGESISVLAILAAAAVMALIEGRRILDYNLCGPRRFTHFLGGLAAGFAALTALVGGLAWGGWLHFGPPALSGGRILGFGTVWAFGFLLTGFFEEGTFRCYLLYTFTRGIDFWWALGAVAFFCLDLVVKARINLDLLAMLTFRALTTSAGGALGVYVIALVLLVPSLVLHLKRAPSSGFWQAAWVTSTMFGFVHTGNNGENWIGIFAAAAIGFIFCVSIWITGSAWWAIGCHAAWDWAETFFYGTADSGMIPKGHFLTTTPTGKVFWSGGTDGPEGSVLILGALALLLLILVVFYRRAKVAEQPTAAVDASPMQV